MSDEPEPVIVCESGERWSAAWRRYHTDATIATVHSVADLQTRLATASDKIAVVEMGSPRLGAWVDWLARRLSMEGDPLVIAVGDAHLTPIRWRLRELGAFAVATNERQLPPICRAVCHHLNSIPGAERSLRDQVWSSLPWRGVATARFHSSGTVE